MIKYLSIHKGAFGKFAPLGNIFLPPHPLKKKKKTVYRIKYVVCTNNYKRNVDFEFILNNIHLLSIT